MMKPIKALIAATVLGMSATAASAATVYDGDIDTLEFRTPMFAGDPNRANAVADPFEYFSTATVTYTGLSFTADEDLLSRTQFTINPYFLDLDGNPANSIAIAYSVDGDTAIDLAIVPTNTDTGITGSGGLEIFLFAGQTLEFQITGQAGASGNQVTFQTDTFDVSQVPAPAAGVLMVGALGAFGALRRKKKNS